MGDYYMIKERPGPFGSVEYTAVVQKTFRADEAFIRFSTIDPKKVLKAQSLDLCERYFDAAWDEREITNLGMEAYHAVCEGRTNDT